MKFSAVEVLTRIIFTSNSSIERPKIAGAVRYFVAGDDPFDDSIFASGLFDDQRIVNHVLEELGLNEHFVLE